MGSIPQRAGRWLRYDRVGGRTAVVEWQGGDGGGFLPRTRAVAGRIESASPSGSHLSQPRFHHHLQRRIQVVARVWVGPSSTGIPHYAEPRSAYHGGRDRGTELRKDSLASA